MEVLTHINKRVKMQPQVKLPTEALLAQYGDASLPHLVHNFTIMYLETALSKYVKHGNIATHGMNHDAGRKTM